MSQGLGGWDAGGVFFAEPIDQGADDRLETRADGERMFKKFIKQFRYEDEFVYRDQLRRNYMLRRFYFEVDLEHVAAFRPELAEVLINSPSDYLPLFETAATEVVDELTRPRPHAEAVRAIQVMLKDTRSVTPIRHLDSSKIGKLVRVPGIVIQAAATKAKATNLYLECRGCQHNMRLALKPGFGGALLPRSCQRPQGEGNPDGAAAGQGAASCPFDPYMIVPDLSVAIDQQVLKLQEAPEEIPTGELPRHLKVSADRFLTERVIPGTRVSMIGIYDITQAGQSRKERKESVAIRNPYLRVVGITTETGVGGRTQATFTEEEESEFLREARSPDVIKTIARSIAPAIWGSDDIKMAVACLLFGGSRKQLPDGMRLRGDVNVLLLGDPGTAKSQFLKFVEKVAPIGVYTSGKGSSAAGLTASVVRESGSRDFYLEGGAMVMADGGVVCIDEFDKMREQDRVAIHEAMEQQTISIAKAGLTAILNSRTSVCAAANGVFGRWDDTQAVADNIDFQSTILSRFDLIFLVRDVHNEERDSTLAKHVMGIHMRAGDPQGLGEKSGGGDMPEGELSLEFLKKYINYCRLKCAPRLSEAASKKLASHFVKFRQSVKESEDASGARAGIPITIRQLEAIVRISESLAKMSLSPFATEQHVDEAVRLFQVATLQAATGGGINGVEGAAQQQDMEEVFRIEKVLEARFKVGSRVSERTIIDDFVGRQGYSEYAVRKVIAIMTQRGQVERFAQGKGLYRISN